MKHACWHQQSCACQNVKTCAIIKPLFELYACVYVLWDHTVFLLTETSEPQSDRPTLDLKVTDFIWAVGNIRRWSTCPSSNRARCRATLIDTNVLTIVSTATFCSYSLVIMHN